MKAVVVGAGIGGLTAALAFQHFGWVVEVVDQASSLGDVGAGIQISPNGVKVLRALGLEPAISKTAFRPEAIEMRLGHSSLRLSHTPLGAGALARWGAPYLHVHRADLIETLADALAHRAPDAIRLGQAVTGYRQDAGRAQVELAAGGTVGGDVVIGADGVHSMIRNQMLGPDAPTFTGNVAWRAVVPVSWLGSLAPPPTACVWAGSKRHAVTYLLRGGQLANFVGVVERDDWTSESWTEQGTKAQALADFPLWHPIITSLIKKAPMHYRWALFDRKPLTRWSEGRVGLLGDACHPTLPFMAQGAVMAMEDAWVLARSCAGMPDNPIAALEAYFHARIERTSGVQAGSRANMKTFHNASLRDQMSSPGRPLQAARRGSEAALARLDGLYAYDVTREPCG